MKSLFRGRPKSKVEIEKIIGRVSFSEEALKKVKPVSKEREEYIRKITKEAMKAATA